LFIKIILKKENNNLFILSIQITLYNSTLYVVLSYK